MKAQQTENKTNRFVEAEVVGTDYLPPDAERGFNERFGITFQDVDNTAYDFVAYTGSEAQRKRLRIAVLSCNSEDFGDIAAGTKALLQLGWNPKKNEFEVNRVLHLDKPRREEIKAEVYNS